MARRQSEKCNWSNCVIYAVVTLLLVTHDVEAKRAWGSSNRKTPSGGNTSRYPSSSNSGHVTKPSYSTSNSGNSHADIAKLSYPNYNSQPNRPASGSVGGSAGQSGQNPPAIGWNVPKQQAGPPPAYSASNPVGGAKTNINESPPSYHSGNYGPPSYGAATGSNVHTPITATNTQGLQSSYPQQSYGGGYHAPAGATYYPSSGQLPAGATYYPSGGHVPPGASYPAGGVPAGASYLPAGAALPPGATYYSQPPQSSSSGLGFGSGLAAGAIGGAILGHVLTPTNNQAPAPAAAGAAGSSGGEDKIIIINNGQPGTVTTENGTTVINTGGSATPVAPVAPVAGAASTNEAPLAPMTDPHAAATNTTTSEGSSTMAPQQGTASEQPPAGGIICVPVRVNETDPADSTKMIEVEKVACYPAPPPPQQSTSTDGSMQSSTSSSNADSSVPLAPLNPVTGQTSQQLQSGVTQGTLMSEQSSVRTANAAAKQHSSAFFFAYSILSIVLAYAIN